MVSWSLANHPKWSGWQELHLRPPPSEGGRLLLTLHPEKLALAEGLSPSSPVLEAPRSLIELREPIEIGCSGWIRTSTVPLNRRADYLLSD